PYLGQNLPPLSTRTLRSIAQFSTWVASYLRPSSAAFITNIAESDFRYTQGSPRSHHEEKRREVPGRDGECGRDGLARVAARVAYQGHCRCLRDGDAQVEPRRVRTPGRSTPGLGHPQPFPLD